MLHWLSVSLNSVKVLLHLGKTPLYLNTALYVIRFLIFDGYYPLADLKACCWIIK